MPAKKAPSRAEASKNAPASATVEALAKQPAKAPPAQTGQNLPTPSVSEQRHAPGQPSTTVADEPATAPAQGKQPAKASPAPSGKKAPATSQSKALAQAGASITVANEPATAPAQGKQPAKASPAPSGKKAPAPSQSKALAQAGGRTLPNAATNDPTRTRAPKRARPTDGRLTHAAVRDALDAIQPGTRVALTLISSDDLARSVTGLLGKNALGKYVITSPDGATMNVPAAGVVYLSVGPADEEPRAPPQPQPSLQASSTRVHYENPSEPRHGAQTHACMTLPHLRATLAGFPHESWVTVTRRTHQGDARTTGQLLVCLQEDEPAYVIRTDGGFIGIAGAEDDSVVSVELTGAPMRPLSTHEVLSRFAEYGDEAFVQVAFRKLDCSPGPEAQSARRVFTGWLRRLAIADHSRPGASDAWLVRPQSGKEPLIIPTLGVEYLAVSKLASAPETVSSSSRPMSPPKQAPPFTRREAGTVPLSTHEAIQAHSDWAAGVVTVSPGFKMKRLPSFSEAAIFGFWHYATYDDWRTRWDLWREGMNAFHPRQPSNKDDLCLYTKQQKAVEDAVRQVAAFFSSGSPLLNLGAFDAAAPLVSDTPVKEMLEVARRLVLAAVNFYYGEKTEAFAEKQIAHFAAPFRPAVDASKWWPLKSLDPPRAKQPFRDNSFRKESRADRRNRARASARAADNEEKQRDGHVNSDPPVTTKGAKVTPKRNRKLNNTRKQVKEE